MLALIVRAQNYLASLTEEREENHGEEGQGMVEYSLVVGLISVVLVAAFATLDIENAITGLSNTITTSLGGSVTP